MITCCTFENSVINLIWNKQYVFFILVVSDLKQTPLRDKVWQEVNKKYHRLTTLKKTFTPQQFLLKKRRSAEQTTWRATGTRICASTVSASITDRKNAEPESRMDNPVWTIEEENTGRNDTRTRMVLKDKDRPHPSQPSRVTSHRC